MSTSDYDREVEEALARLDPIVVNTDSYEEYITERLKDDNEIIVYLQAVVNGYEMDRDLNELLFCLKAVLIAKGHEGKPITLEYENDSPFVPTQTLLSEIQRMP